MTRATKQQQTDKSKFNAYWEDAMKDDFALVNLIDSTEYFVITDKQAALDVNIDSTKRINGILTAMTLMPPKIWAMNKLWVSSKVTILTCHYKLSTVPLNVIQPVISHQLMSYNKSPFHRR
jgi:hypothetical protein